MEIVWNRIKISFCVRCAVLCVCVIHKRFLRTMPILFPNVFLDFVIKSVAKRKEKPNATKLIKSLTNTASSCGHFL